MENKNTENNDKAMLKTDEEVITLPMFKILWVKQNERIILMTHEGINKLAAKDASKLPLIIQSSMLILDDPDGCVNIIKILQASERYGLICMPHNFKKSSLIKQCSEFEKRNFFFLNENLTRATSYAVFWNYLRNLYAHINLIFERESALPIESVKLSD